MKNLNHPYIVKLYDTIIDEDTDNVYLVMEYMGRGFFQIFKQKTIKRENSL